MDTQTALRYTYGVQILRSLLKLARPAALGATVFACTGGASTAGEVQGSGSLATSPGNTGHPPIPSAAAVPATPTATDQSPTSAPDGAFVSPTSLGNDSTAGGVGTSPGSTTTAAPTGPVDIAPSTAPGVAQPEGIQTSGMSEASNTGDGTSAGQGRATDETSTGDDGATGTSETSAEANVDSSAETGSATSFFPSEVTKPRIMIVGDSISAGPGCYKKYLDEQLKDNQITSYEFVGEYTDDCGGGVKHSAVSCTTTAQYTQPTFMVPNCFEGESFPGMSTLMAEHNPDLVMLQLGVNDVWNGNAAIEPILANYKTLVDQARAHNPNVVVIVAQIHQVITENCANTASTTNAEQLIKAVPGWASGVSTEQSPVLTADLWTNSDAQEAEDCVHPDDAGARRMALNWFNVLKDILP